MIKKKENTIGPGFIEILIAVFVLYVLANTFMVTNLVVRVGEIEHTLEHAHGH